MIDVGTRVRERVETAAFVHYFHKNWWITSRYRQISARFESLHEHDQ